MAIVNCGPSELEHHAHRGCWGPQRVTSLYPLFGKPFLAAGGKITQREQLRCRVTVTIVGGAHGDLCTCARQQCSQQSVESLQTTLMKFAVRVVGGCVDMGCTDRGTPRLEVTADVACRAHASAASQY